MSSQFDALLDFGDDPPPSTNGTAQQANGGDDFDPFGPGPLDSGKGGGGGGDGGLLLDFSMSTETSTAKNGTSSDPFDSQFSLTANADSDVNNSAPASTNPFADMSTTEAQPSANPLYDLMDEDFSQQPQASEPSAVNPLYDLDTNSDLAFESNVTTTTTTTVEEDSSANPLYNLMDQDEAAVTTTTETKTETSSDLLGMDFGAGEVTLEKSTPSEDILVQTNNNYADDQIVPDLSAPQEAGPRDEEEEEAGEGFDQNVELFIREEGEDQTPAQASAGGLEAELDIEEQQQQQQPEEVVEEEEKMEQQEQEVVQEKARSRSRTPSVHSISSEGEVINEEEEMRQDERAVLQQSQQQEEQQEEEKRRSYQETEQTGEAAFGGGDQKEDYGLEETVTREQKEKEDFHFQDMSSVKNQFEQGPKETAQQRQAPIDIRQEVSSTEPQWEDEPEEGVYENEPEQRPDVVRETDRNIGAELPSVGTAKSMRDKFVSGQVENAAAERKKEVTPPAMSDGGVFENEPKFNPDVVHSGEQSEEPMPEQGITRNLAARFKEMEKEGAVPVPSPGKREITPDRTGKVEYVSEPRGHVEKYEPEVQAGIFESQPAERADVIKSDELAEEVLPEKGSAKNMAERFKQMSTEKTAATPRGKREITPDTSGRVEYVSEPTGFVEKYEGRTESGVFESQPAEQEGVVKSDVVPEDVMPEQGMARNIAARFKEMEKTTKSPPSPSKVKEFTPPRENGAPAQPSGVYESTPQVASDVIHADDQVEEVLPEKGTARSIADRFRQLSSGGNTPAKSPRSKKEFTPPPGGSGVYENTPKQFVPDYNKPAESGILESKPETRNDVVRSEDPVTGEQELPEQGYTKNLLSAWRQKESESSKVSPPSSGKPKEFTPPREEPRVAQQRPAPRTPKSPQAGTDMNDGSVHPSDLPGQYQPQAEASVYESQPERREDVVREEDTDWQQGMPKPDTTKKMLAKFKHIQQQAGTSTDSQPAKPKPTARKEEEDRNSKESSPDKVGRSKSMRVAVQLEKCGACQKTVYAMEKIEIEKHSYHKSCFRCTHCHCVLTPKTFAINNNVMFCTTHYKQLFATKGNYDEGFGRDQHKKRWKSEPNLADDEHSSSASAHH